MTPYRQKLNTNTKQAKIFPIDVEQRTLYILKISQTEEDIKEIKYQDVAVVL